MGELEGRLLRSHSSAPAHLAALPDTTLELSEQLENLRAKLTFVQRAISDTQRSIVDVEDSKVYTHTQLIIWP